MSAEYKNKFVAYIDILGIKSAVQRSENEGPEELHWLFTNVCDESNFLEELKKHYTNKEDYVIRMFSDSMYFSYPEHGGIDLLEDISEIILCATDMNYFFRGGITYGKIFEDSNIMYGPAMTKAYLLESQIAHYPRIIIDDEAKTMLRRYMNNSSNKQRLSDWDRLIFDDYSDGLCTLNFLMKKDKNAAERLRILNNNLQYSMNHPNKDKKIRAKNQWMINYFNSQVDRINERMSKGRFKCEPLKKVQL